jgi:hypothetical protein
MWYGELEPNQVFGTMLVIRGVKIFTDGGVCDLVAAGEPIVEGLETREPFHSVEVVTRLVQEAQDAGYQTVIHAQGDLAVDVSQQAIANVLGGGPNELRHRIDHNAVVTAELRPRYSEIGISPVVFGSFPTCSDTAWTEFWKVNGEPWRALIDANPGLPVAWHGDDPWVVPVSPLIELASLVTRAEVTDDGTRCEPEPWLAEDAVTVEEGLAMMTRNSAYALHREDELGTLSPGKFADLVVLSADPHSVEPFDLFDLEVQATIVGGAVEYCTPAAIDLCGPAESESSVQASRSLSEEPPELAFDGDPDTQWGAGADAEQWIEVDLGAETTIAGVRLIVGQWPEGHTVHRVEIDGAEVHVFAGETMEGDVLEAQFDSGTTGRVIRIVTIESPSWVAWKEIEILRET